MTTPTTYRELQQTLKAMRERGVEVQCRLNASTDVLLSEYARLTGDALNIKTKKQQKAESQPVRKHSYRELQQKLKAFREDGFNVQCKLNAKYDVLEAEYTRIMNEAEKETHNTSIHGIKTADGKGQYTGDYTTVNGKTIYAVQSLTTGQVFECEDAPVAA